jgi:2-haloacid dehalogenase
MIEALVFDAYGTLFDVHSVGSLCDALWPGQGTSVSRIWRSKQLEYSWLRTLMRRYVDFETLTADALRWTCDSLGVRCGATEVEQLLAAYRNLPVFPDVLRALRGVAGRKRAILSNGSPPMLDALVQNSRLEGLIDVILSVDTLGIYKPDPRVYQLAVDTLHVEAGHIGFVSANGWDISGARSFGLHTYWINRNGAPRERLTTEPDHELTTLSDVVGLLR